MKRCSVRTIKGLSLIELMISLALSLIIVATAIYGFQQALLVQRRTNDATDTYTYVRTVFQAMERAWRGQTPRNNGPRELYLNPNIPYSSLSSQGWDDNRVMPESEYFYFWDYWSRHRYPAEPWQIKNPSNVLMPNNSNINVRTYLGQPMDRTYRINSWYESYSHQHGANYGTNSFQDVIGNANWWDVHYGGDNMMLHNQYNAIYSRNSYGSVNAEIPMLREAYGLRYLPNAGFTIYNDPFNDAGGEGISYHEIGRFELWMDIQFHYRGTQYSYTIPGLLWYSVNYQ